ncbi:CTLH/CRA C-terminal to lish motif domain-containing protein [Boletus edulis]|nr:CTLH/CRA C-terminal to lish motif domain-containing protein [Boletus edulis]
MPTVTGKGRQLGDGSVDTANNQSLAEQSPDNLRNLVLNYLCHNCYLKTAEAFAKDSAIRHLDKDGDDIRDRPTLRVENGMRTIGYQASSADLSDDMVWNILLRRRIQFEILSGHVQEAIDLLNRHFPKVLAEDVSDNQMEVTDENETVNPIHLLLNLRMLAFIEACRTVPLVYTPPTRSIEPISMNTDDTIETHQAELLISVQKLYATVNALRKSDDRAIYLKELSNVGGLLAYTVPEKSPMAKYLHQERRDRVAEQINSAILHHTNMPSVSYLELAVRYTHCLWAMLHELRVKLPVAHRPSGVSLPPGIGPQGTGESEKELSHEASFFLTEVSS